MKTLITALCALALTAMPVVAGPRHEGHDRGGHFTNGGVRGGHSHFGGWRGGSRGGFHRWHGDHWRFRHGYWYGEIVILDDGCWYWDGFNWVVYVQCYDED